MVTVRPAALPDAPAMGRVHVRAWQAAYHARYPTTIGTVQPTANMWRLVG
jgi:hypothetical protein